MCIAGNFVPRQRSAGILSQNMRGPEMRRPESDRHLVRMSFTRTSKSDAGLDGDGARTSTSELLRPGC